MHFFGQFKDYNSERKHGNWTNDPIFSSTFSALLFQSQSPSFCCPLFSENYLNSQARIKKIVNKHTVDYHPSLSQLISRIHTLIFLWTPKGFISPRIFLDFFPKPVYSTMVMEKFQIYSVRITANTFMSIKLNLFNFTHASKRNSPHVLSLSSSQTRIAHFSRVAFLKIFFPEEKGERELWS